MEARFSTGAVGDVKQQNIPKKQKTIHIPLRTYCDSSTC